MYVLAPDPVSSTSRRWRLALAAAAVTLGGLGLGMGETDAAPSAWDRLARCEASGDWRINTGNGYYGGLQFSKASWDWAGGKRYARWPHRATRAEQIRTGKRLLRLQPASAAWPTCSRRLGLSRKDLLGSSGGSGTSSKATPSKTSGNNSSSTPSGSSSGRTASATMETYRVRSGDSLSSIAVRLNVSGGWRAIHRANDGRIANPSVIFAGQVLRLPGAGSGDTTSSTSRRDAPATSTDRRHRVRPGETLAGIARRNGVSGGWVALFRANDDRIRDPNVIRIGQVLRLP